jgi:hypothetical protein
MKTSKKLKALRMWANYYAQGQSMSIHGSKKLAQNLMEFEPTHQAVPVAVIPLDDPEGLIFRASCVVDNMISSASIGDIVRAVLVSSGVLPSKGGRK